MLAIFIIYRFLTHCCCCCCLLSLSVAVADGLLHHPPLLLVDKWFVTLEHTRPCAGGLSFAKFQQTSQPTDGRVRAKRAPGRGGCTYDSYQLINIKDPPGGWEAVCVGIQQLLSLRWWWWSLTGAASLVSRELVPPYIVGFAARGRLAPGSQLLLRPI
uniref:Putative secreted protein n=1 Tax=Anopheles darlingi TaxID=43151 RepID=A0A2M4DKL2_ANODA